MILNLCVYYRKRCGIQERTSLSSVPATLYNKEQAKQNTAFPAPLTVMFVTPLAYFQRTCSMQECSRPSMAQITLHWEEQARQQAAFPSPSTVMFMTPLEHFQKACKIQRHSPCSASLKLPMGNRQNSKQPSSSIASNVHSPLGVLSENMQHVRVQSSAFGSKHSSPQHSGKQSSKFH